MSWILRVASLGVSATPSAAPGAGLRSGVGVVVLALLVGGLLLMLSRLRRR